MKSQYWLGNNPLSEKVLIQTNVALRLRWATMYHQILDMESHHDANLVIAGNIAGDHLKTGSATWQQSCHYDNLQFAQNLTVLIFCLI